MSIISLKSSKKLLYEVSIIRPIIIYLLVFLHSFTKINNGGGIVRDYHLPDFYQWMCYFISGFRIETIALVAGYVFSYQCNDLKRSYKFWPFVKKKVHRLIIPMLFFGTIYYFMFFLSLRPFSIKHFAISILSGCGHLWFLPMLFWCFLSIWVIDHYKLSSLRLLFILAFFSLLPLNSLPLGFGRFPHFLFFVYAGYYLWLKRSFLLQNALKSSIIFIFIILYFALVIISQTILCSTYNELFLNKICYYFVSSSLRLLMSCCGILSLYLVVCRFVTKEDYKPKQFVINASDNCYGLYVYHQFVLVWLYFYSPLYDLCNEYLLPWVGFVITFFLSMLLTRLTLKTKLGTYLIG